jgi:hypothetical protein
VSAPRLAAPVLAALAALAAGCSKGGPAPEVEAEVARREAFAHALALDAGQETAWGVSSRSDVRFEDGLSFVQYDPPDDFRGRAFRFMGQRATIRLAPRGDRPMRLLVYGWIDTKAIRTRPVVSAFIDGRLVATNGPVEPEGVWGIDTVIAPEILGGKRWVNLVLVLSSVAFHWDEPPVLKVAVLTGLEWEPAP